MINKFDSANYPETVPDDLTIGSRWAWKNTGITEVYPTTLYTLRFVFSLQESTQTPISITAAKTDSAHIVEVGQSTTSTYSNGLYLWNSIIIRDSDSEEVVIGEGFTNFGYDLTALTGDSRSHNYKVLQAINATIEKTATKEQESYSIAGRSLSRRSITELMMLKNEYEQLWKEELKAIKRKQGIATNDRVQIKMGA
jgi:hypothetical protein